MSVDGTLDRQLPTPRKRRGTSIFVAYTIAGALLLGAGALSLGHLSDYRPSVAGQPATVGQAATQPSAPAAPTPPVVITQAPPPSQPPSPATASATTVRMPSATVKMPEPQGAAAPSPATPAVTPAPPQAKAPVAPTPLSTAPAPPPPTRMSPGFGAPAPAAPSVATDAAADTGPVNLIAANGLPLPPPEKPAAATSPVAPAPPAAAPATPPAAPATAAADTADGTVNLIAANGLPLPPPEKPAAATTPVAPAPAVAAPATPPAVPAPSAVAPVTPPAPPAPSAVAPVTPPVTPPAAPATAAADTADGTVDLIAANGLPLPPPEKPSVPGRRVGKCPAGTDLADMIEASPGGRLPRIAGNGCMPWLAYAGDFDHLDRERPRLGMAVIGIGLNEALTQKAVETLPPGATLVFMPETPNLDRWIRRARERGLEAVLMLPSQNPQGVAERGMPPLQKGLAPAENIRRLRAVLEKATGYVGVGLLPSPVLEDNATLRPLLEEIRDRGLMVLEFERWNGRSLVHAISRELGIPYSTDIDSPIAWVDRFNANGRETTAADVDAGLGEVEKYVRSARFGVGWSLARPLAVDRIAAWAAGARTRGILLAPVTGVTECAEICQKRLPRVQQPPAAATR
jgi:polysaccharide deacetylase 2 family uncharacterized protein YibQ